MAKTKNRQIYDSESHSWMTDPRIVNAILNLSFVNKEKFDADLACTIKNIPAFVHITEEEDSIKTEWPKSGDLFLNPPYGLILKKFVEKCAKHVAENPECRIWLILPVRAENLFYHESIYQQSAFTFFFARKQFFSKDGVFEYKTGKEAPFAVQLTCYTDTPVYHGKIFKEEFPFRGTTFIGV